MIAIYAIVGDIVRDVGWVARRHCERSAAIQAVSSRVWIAASLRSSQ
jgi:hypothetical protein